MEVLAKPSDDKPTACTSCGSSKLSKVMSRTSFQLRGGGWYAQGYGQSGAAKSGSSTETADSGGDSGGSSGGSSDSSDSATSSKD